MHRSTVGILVILAALVAGCRETPVASPKTVAAGLASDPRGDGAAAVQRQDWPTAAAHYAEALKRTPDDVMLRFAYGSVLTRIDRLADAAEQYAWVVEHGKPGQPEVVTARQWLERAGLGTRAASTSAPAATEATTRTTDAPPAAPRPDPAFGLVEGKTAWPGVGPDESVRLSVQLRLTGESEPTAHIRKRLSVEIGTGFTWQGVPAGPYRLVGESKGVKLWDVPVTVEASKTTTVDLSASNAAARPADFPPRG